MLRILVISLFIANLLLLGFQKDNPVVKPETTAPQSLVKDSAIPTIHLFSEMIENQDLLSGSRRCFSLGPFHALEEQDEIRTRLQAVSTGINERQTEALVEKGYWVFMPPYTSLLEANEEVLALQALGLEDISVVYSGDWKNAISLGYFMRQENALRRKKSLEERGYAPQMRVQRQAEPRYWLEYEQSPGSELLTLDMQNRPNDFMQRALPCPEQDLFEVAGTDSQDPVGELAQQQTPEAENDPDPGEVAGSAESTGSTAQEVVETVPQSTIEVVGSGNEADVAEGVEIQTQDDVETPTDAAIETTPQSTGEIGSSEVIDAVQSNENEPVESAAALLDQAVETMPETPGEEGNGEETDIVEGIENAPQDAVETLIDAATETVPESTGEVGGGEETDVVEDIEHTPQDAMETLTDAANETDPENTGEAGNGEEADAVNGSENAPQDAVETSTDAAIETVPENTGEVETGGDSDSEENIQNASQESAEDRAVGTGPEWFGESAVDEEADAAEGVENEPVEDTETLLNPGTETEPESTGETGTGEG